MGSFLGHVVPGTFFFSFAIWWLYNIFYRYFYAKRFRPQSYRNTSCFTSPPRSFPMESIVKIGAVCFGILGEFVTGFENGHFTHYGNAQHMTMFFFFGLNGIVDLLQYKNWELPRRLDYITATLGFIVEGFLFFNHLHGRSHMDIQVHMFLFYIIVACACSTVLEMSNPKNVSAALMRSFFTMFQGTWFYQIGFFLYPPIGDKWDQMDHAQMMTVTLVFTWHMAALLMMMMGFGILIWLRVEKMQGPGPLYQMLETADDPLTKILNGGTTNGHVKGKSLHQIIDSESEEV